MRWLHNILSALAYFFVFKKPRFLELEYIDLLVEDKPLFLISWKLKYGNRIRLQPLKTSFRSREGSALVRLPHRPGKLDILASSFWRSKRHRVILTYTTLDAATAAALIQQYKPLSTVNVQKISVSVRAASVPATPGIVSVRSFTLSIQNRFGLHRRAFDYL